ncbi:MAG: hypothetical protein AB1405_02315 [Bdellovibrionota bacterium]
MKRIIAGISLFFLSACGPQTIRGGTEAISYKYPGQVGKRYEKIVVFADLQEEPGIGLFTEITLCNELERYGRINQNPVFCTPRSALQGSQRANADALIEIKLTAVGSKVVIEPRVTVGTKNATYTSGGGHGTSEWASFTVRLTDMASNEVAWTAAAFARSGTRGDVGDMIKDLALEIAQQLRRNDLLPGR